MAPSIPAGWVRGQLIDLKRYTDSLNRITYRATLLGQDWAARDHKASVDPDGLTKPEWEAENAIFFDSPQEVQDFISAWYQPAPARRYG